MQEDVNAQTVWETVQTVEDPELPITIGHLGIVEEIKVTDGNVEITLIPTFVGCPALNVIEQRVQESVATLPGVTSVKVHWDFSTKWSRERVAHEAVLRLHEYGVERPQSEEIHCPYCSSVNVHLESTFGPSLCRSVYFCDTCHNPFEIMKSISPKVEVFN